MVIAIVALGGTDEILCDSFMIFLLSVSVWAPEFPGGWMFVVVDQVLGNRTAQKNAAVGIIDPAAAHPDYCLIFVFLD
ncbi:MAG: hypothetical protein QGH94_17585 [Phycisphaerae bacterium]|jgi:hypothetical protein|nr:hypothetical protein [Phycisphaerae bacterium]